MPLRTAFTVVLWLILAMNRIMAEPSPPFPEQNPPSGGSPQRVVAELSGLRAVHAACDWFSNHTRELADRQMEVTRIPAPPFGEAHRAEWLRARFVEMGLEEVHIDEAGNVLGIRYGTVTGSKFVALSAHMDTVFPPGTPIDVRRDRERLFGPGISDNGSGLIALLAVGQALHSANVRNAAPILFIANVGEEGEGDLRGMRYIFNHPRWRDAIA